MAAGATFSQRRKQFYRSTRILLSTSLDAIQSWESYLQIEQTATGLLHDARELTSECRVHFAAQNVDVNSGSALWTRQDFEKTGLMIHDFRGRLVGVRERLRTTQNLSARKGDSKFFKEAKNVGMTDDEATAYAVMARKVEAVDPGHATRRQEAAKLQMRPDSSLSGITAAHRDFDAVLSKNLGTAKEPGRQDNAPLGNTLFGSKDICKAVGVPPSKWRWLVKLSKRTDGPLHGGRKGVGRVLSEDIVIKWFRITREASERTQETRDAAEKAKRKEFGPERATGTSARPGLTSPTAEGAEVGVKKRRRGRSKE